MKPNQTEGSTGVEKKHPDFPEWIESKDGESCMQWPISEPKYLQNRLFWAFDAGRNCVWDQYMAQKKQLDEQWDWHNSFKELSASHIKQSNEMKSLREQYNGKVSLGELLLSAGYKISSLREQNAACLAALKELIPIAEVGQSYYRQNPGFDWVKEREKSKSAIERAKKLAP